MDEPARVVVRGTIEQEPFAHGTEATVPLPAPLSLASYEEVMSGLPHDPLNRSRWLLRMPTKLGEVDIVLLVRMPNVRPIARWWTFPNTEPARGPAHSVQDAGPSAQQAAPGSALQMMRPGEVTFSRTKFPRGREQPLEAPRLDRSNLRTLSPEGHRCFVLQYSFSPCSAAYVPQDEPLHS